MNPALASGITGAAPIWNRVMAKFKGRELRIKVRTATSPETFTVVGGIVTGKQTIIVTGKQIGRAHV